MKTDFFLQYVIKDNPDALKLKDKSWPLYDDWLQIWGKDRANGENAEDILDAIKELELESASKTQDNNTGDYYVNLDEIFGADNAADNAADKSDCQSQPPEQIAKNKGKKRKASDGIDSICSVLAEMSRNTSARLDILASRIGYDHDLAKARKEVFEKLGNIPGLSLDDKFNICDILAKQVEKLEVFLGLPEDARGPYVGRLL